MRFQVLNKKCQVDDCLQPVRAKRLCQQHYNASYHEANKIEHNKKSKIWHARNKEKHRASQKAWHYACPEYWTVKSHWSMIFGSEPRPTYVGMPFFEKWNPRKQGSFITGANWIVENLGPRPSKEYQLHVIQKSVGFVPGNLMWIPTSQHKRSELINLLLEENQRLRQEIKQEKSNG